jgi:hypothetical protein
MRRLAYVMAGVCVLAVGCGDDDDDGGGADAAVADAPVADGGPDGGPDAGPDAAVPSFSGTISFQEVRVQGIPQLGQGLQIRINFQDDLTAKPPTLEEMPGSSLGCKAWEYTAAEATALSLDEGKIDFTVMDGAPVLPSCTFVPTRGYLCIGQSGTGGVLAAGPQAGTMLFTAPTGDFTLGDVGHYVSISGATNAANNGQFPLVNVVNQTTVVIAHQAGVVETLPGAATWAVVAGVGPNPAGAMLANGFLENDDVVTVALTAGGGNHVEAFSVTFDMASGAVGDDFTLDTASQAEITSVPTDGSAFSIGCDGAGGTCNMATGSLLVITTTDTPVTGLPPFVFPPPTTKQVVIRCAAIGAGTVTVPAAYSALIQGSGATRIQTAFFRSSLNGAQNTGDPKASVTIVAGHGVAGFTTP